MFWGLTRGGWMAGLIKDADDPYRAQLELLAEHGLRATSWGGRGLMEMSDARRDQIAGWLREMDIRVGIGVGFDYLSEDPAEVGKGTERALATIETLAEPMRAPFCTTGIRRRYHRFSLEIPLEEQLDRLPGVLGPIADAAGEAGCPLAVHKSIHYGSDLAELCRRTPGLGIMLDTGNAFLVGEKPLRAARDAAPYTVVTHFKDHYAEPTFSPLGLRVRGAVPGTGHAHLAQIYDLLCREAPDADDMAMLFEIDPIEGVQRREALRLAVEFARELEGRESDERTGCVRAV